MTRIAELDAVALERNARSLQAAYFRDCILSLTARLRGMSLRGAQNA